MPAISSLRSQRLSGLKSAPDKQYVAFRLRFGWFILPIESIYRVIPLEKQIPKLTFAGQKVVIVDLGKMLFGQNKTQTSKIPQLIANGAIVSSKPSLIVVRGDADKLVGVLSNSQPALQKIALNQLVPLPRTYSQNWKVDYINYMTLPSQDTPSLFAIDSNLFVTKMTQS
jgi:chemotaxis signal transduction protein